MSSEAKRFVCRALSPSVLSAASQGEVPASLLPNSTPAAFWDEVLSFAESVHAQSTIAEIALRFPLPEAIRPRLERISTLERMRLTLLDELLFEALPVLQGAGITPIVLKGMDLGRRYYPARLLRPMRDVDLLVEPARFEEAIATLEKIGLFPIGPFPKGRFRIELARSPEEPSIELHARLQSHEPEAITRRALDRAERDGIHFPKLAKVLHPNDQVPYLIRHASVQHLIESPLWLLDLHYVITAEAARLDWTEILKTIEARHYQAATALCLRLLRSQCGTDFPPSVLSTLEAKMPMMARHFLPKASAQDWFSREDRSALERIAVRFLLRDRPIDALSYLWERYRTLPRPS